MLLSRYHVHYHTSVYIYVLNYCIKTVAGNIIQVILVLFRR